MSNKDQGALSVPPGKFINVYVTSKRIHAAELLALRGNWEHINFTARWPVVRDISTEQSRPASLWLQDNVDDILRSDVLVCKAEKADMLSGSIWEVGVAWANGKPIYLVGDNAGFKEWRHATNTWHYEHMENALTHITARLRYDASGENRLANQLQNGFDRLGTLIDERLRKLAEVNNLKPVFPGS